MNHIGYAFAMQNRTPIAREERAPLPEFAPVPRKFRHDGWTPERQRAFIGALADTGAVSRAARMVNMSPEGAYYLRRQPGAEEFRRAWDAALDFGVQRLKDIAFERAIDGQLVPVFVAGKLMGFRRKRNDRLLMFCLRHYGQDAQGRRVTIDYFRSKAGANSSPSSSRGGGPLQAVEGAAQSAAMIPQNTAEASTTTIRTTITGPDPAQRGRAQKDDASAEILDAFEGVPLDEEAQAQIAAVLTACAERQRTQLPEEDLNEPYIPIEQAGLYTGEFVPGPDSDREDLPPERQGHREDELNWETLGDEEQIVALEAAVASVEAARRKAEEKGERFLEGPELDA